MKHISEQKEHLGRVGIKQFTYWTKVIYLRKPFTVDKSSRLTGVIFDHIPLSVCAVFYWTMHLQYTNLDSQLLINNSPFFCGQSIQSELGSQQRLEQGPDLQKILGEILSLSSFFSKFILSLY